MTYELDTRLTPCYSNLMKELSNKERYRTYSVAEFYCDCGKQPDPTKINVVLRIDVDFGFHLSIPLAEALNKFGVHASHYFLTFPSRYYSIWDSGIPRRIAELGQEVGLHSDHLFDELTNRTDGLSRLKDDLAKLGEEAGQRIRGVVYHGHHGINALGRTNWELTRDIPAKSLGLDYHEGLKDCYIKPGASFWEPDCDMHISDWMGFSKSWGWNYYSDFPIKFLRKGQPGMVLHLTMHTHSAFEYWKDWKKGMNEYEKYKDAIVKQEFKKAEALINTKLGRKKRHRVRGIPPKN